MKKDQAGLVRKIYIICPVRKLNEEEKVRILNYVQTLESLEFLRHEVRCPFRDTPQEDEIGLRIVEDHEQDIIWADEIHIWWNPTSEGSLWDLAQARMVRRFMPAKKICLINLDQMNITEHKSYNNVLIATHFGLKPGSTLEELKKCLENFKN